MDDSPYNDMAYCEQFPRDYDAAELGNDPSWPLYWAQVCMCVCTCVCVCVQPCQGLEKLACLAGAGYVLNRNYGRAQESCEESHRLCKRAAS